MLFLTPVRMITMTLLLVLALPALGLANPVWSLRKDQDGIRIFTAKLANEAVKAVKVECLVAARPEQLLALLLDVDNNHEWVYKTESSRLLKSISPQEIIYYAQMECPWPFSNRDIVAHLKIARESDKVITIDSRAQPDFIPAEEDVVRITSSKGKWTITNVKENLIKVEYVIQINPGGNIPPWLINLFLTDGPLESFRKMKERVALAKYKDARMEF
jgi:hypothetical protein